ncbi:MAG: hypothetical protein ABI548_25225 [Polyangiaceae bacterium]
MNTKSGSGAAGKKSGSGLPWWALVAPLVVVILGALLYFWVLFTRPHNADMWGNLGSAVSPFVALLNAGALLAAVYSVWMQRDQLQRQREAEMNEAVDRANTATEKAYATLEDLRGVSRSLGKISATMIARLGLFDALPNPQKLALFEELAVALAKLGIQADLDGVGRPLLEIVRLHHVFKLRDALYKAAEKADPSTAADFLTQLSPLADQHNVPNPAFCRDLVVRLRHESAEIADALSDYEYFEKHRELRRSEVWK